MSESGCGGPTDSKADSNKDSSVECPTCNDDFDTVKGMKIHHAKQHGESIQGVKVECETCGDMFPVRPWREDSARFCTEKCEGEWRSKVISGDGHHKWRGGDAELVCEICGDDFTVSRDREDQRCCSPKCRFKLQSELCRGEDNPNWKGGKHQHDYGPDWYKIRKEIRKRDNYTCQDCGCHQDELECKLHVHHVIPFRKFTDGDGEDDYERANRRDNLVALCQPCHNRWEGIPLKPQ